MRSLEPHAVGIGWRQPHYRELIDRQPALGFIEVHSENFFAQGGATLAVLTAGREAYPLSLHGVGLGLGSQAGLDEWHLNRLAQLVHRFEPALVSDHACFARTPAGPHAADLLPIAFDDATLDLMVRHVQQVQERLGRRFLVENISAYLAWGTDHIAEPEFFNALTRRSGCALLLDLNNLFVNARNRGDAPDAAADAAKAWLDALDPGCVAQIHLAGHCDLPDLVIDDHGSRVRDPVWQVYRHALQRLGPVPTLIEWDTAVPALDVLLDEADRARQCHP